MEQWCYTQKTGFFFYFEPVLPLANFYGSDIDLLKSEFKIFSNVKSENDISITQFRDESRRLHHM
jgi:hypothetical protein